MLKVGRMKFWAPVLIGLAVALTVGYAWGVGADAWPWLRGPASWPPEWRWLYAPLGWTRPGRSAVHIGVLVAYVLAAAALMRPRGARRPGLAVALAVGFLFLWQLTQTWAREDGLLDTLIFRVYAPPLNGFFIAPVQVQDVGETLRHYLAAMPGFFGDKPRTHPPGLFIFYALFNSLFAHLPGISAWWGPIARGWAIPGRDWPQLSDSLLASATVTAWLQILLASLAPLSLYALLRELFNPGKATARAPDLALWATLAVPLIPALSLFVLQWDTNFPALGFAAWYFAIRGQNRLWAHGPGFSGRRGLWFWSNWLWAGLLFSLLTWISFGTAVFGVMIALHVLWREAWWAGRRHPGIIVGLALMAAAWALPWFLAYLAWGMNFFALMRAGLAYHYSIVTTFRDYRIWWWMNLVDFALWQGPATVALGAVGTGWLLARRIGERAPRSHGRPPEDGAPAAAMTGELAGMAVVFWFTLLLLNFSGTTRGEIGRLWIFLMPFPALFGLALPWSYRQRVVLLLLLAFMSWFVGFVIPPFLCC